MVFSHEYHRQSNVWMQDVAFTKGERILIEAESGSGKSSLASYIYGQRTDYLGTILFDGRDIRNIKATEWDSIHRTNLSILFQELRLFPELTAIENITLKNRLSCYKNQEEIFSLFDILGIADKTDTLVAHMSYGQQQRVAFIRALCQPFDFFIADEPVSHIDDSNARKMAEVLLRESEMRGAGVIITSIGKHFDIEYTRALKL